MASRRSVARPAVAGLALVATLAGVTGCGATSRAAPSGTMSMADGTVMKGSQMPSMMGSSGRARSGPSASAMMICSVDVAGAVNRNLGLRAMPPRISKWADRTYTCGYTLPGGTLKLSVKDLTSLPAGRAWFEALRNRLPHSTTIHGLDALGFPAFESSSGGAVFLKDGKTLWVDATHVPAALIPAGSTRMGVAYGVAAAVIACWKE